MIKKPKKITGSQRLATPAAKKELIKNVKENTTDMMRIIAGAKEPPEVKEKLANMFIFILNVVDIEGERLIFDEIRSKNPKRAGRVLQKD